MSIYNELLHRPLVNALVLIYENLTFYDLGLAIIVLTVIIRIILFPLFHKATKHQKIVRGLQPQVKKLQEQYKNDREAQAKAVMALYREKEVNPFSSMFIMLIQLPILFAIYGVFKDGFGEKAFASLYSFVNVPVELNHTLLGLIDLNVVNWPIAILAALAQYLQIKLSAQSISGTEDKTAQRMVTQMSFIAPGIMLFALSTLPAAMGLYWLTSTIFSLVQQVIVNKHLERDVAKQNDKQLKIS